MCAVNRQEFGEKRPRSSRKLNRFSSECKYREPCRNENTFGGILVTLGSKPCLELVIFILLVLPTPFRFTVRRFFTEYEKQGPLFVFDQVSVT